MKVRDVMRTEVTTTTRETPLKDVARLLAERGISGLPVVDASGAVVGVVSEGDFVEKAQAPHPHRGGIRGWLSRSEATEEAARLEARTAGEAMTSPAVTIEPDASVTRAASLMVEREVNRLPVVADGKLVGIVTRADVVRAFTREDAEIRKELEDDVILRRFWIAPETVNVTVENGEVSLAGEVESQSVAELLAAYVERVPGVVSVTSTLSWREARRP